MSEQNLPTEDQRRAERARTGGQILDILSVCGEPEVMDIDDPVQKVRALIDAAIVHRALIAELVEALGRAAGYLRDLEANMLANDLDMRLDIRVPPSVIAEDVEVAIAKAKSESAP